LLATISDPRKVWKDFLWREKAMTFKRAKNGIGQVGNEKMQETDQGHREYLDYKSISLSHFLGHS